MSFILDALRKSDAERQRAVTPGLSDVRYAARRSRRNVWLPILVVVLTANALFLGVQWLRPQAAPDAGPAAQQAVVTPSPAAESPPASAPTATTAPTADIRPLAREAEFGEPPLGPDVESEFAPLPGPAPAPVIMEVPESLAGEAVQEPVSPPAKPSRILAGNDLPTAEQLMGAGALNVPVLNLDLHVYSAAPAGRFVVINARKYKEGAQLSEGPTVEGITLDGVILSHQGTRFTLARK